MLLVLLCNFYCVILLCKSTYKHFLYIVYYEIVVWCTQSFRLFYRLIQFLFSFFILNILSVENFLCFYQCICTLSYCKSCLTFLIQGCLHLRKLSIPTSRRISQNQNKVIPNSKMSRITIPSRVVSS